MENKIAGIRRDRLNLIISSKMKDRLNSSLYQTSWCSLCILRDLELANARSRRMHKEPLRTRRIQNLGGPVRHLILRSHMRPQENPCIDQDQCKTIHAKTQD